MVEWDSETFHPVVIFPEQPKVLDLSGSQDYGIDGDYIEAAAFAWLAFCNLNNLSIDWKQFTGASKSGTLGVIFG